MLYIGLLTGRSKVNCFIFPLRFLFSFHLDDAKNVTRAGHASTWPTSLKIGPTCVQQRASCEPRLLINLIGVRPIRCDPGKPAPKRLLDVDNRHDANPQNREIPAIL